MKKTIITVFLVLAVLVFVFLIWELFFAEKGILHTIYNGAASGINTQWAKLAGNNSTLVPLWDGTGTDNKQYNDTHTEQDQQGFGIDVHD